MKVFVLTLIITKSPLCMYIDQKYWKNNVLSYGIALKVSNYEKILALI